MYVLTRLLRTTFTELPVTEHKSITSIERQRFDWKEDNLGYSDSVVFKAKKPIKVMVFGLAGSGGQVMPPIMFEPEERLNATGYLAVLEKCKEWVIQSYPDTAGVTDVNGNIFINQVSIPRIKVSLTRRWCTCAPQQFCPALAQEQLRQEEVSPDLNLWDYSLWNQSAQEVRARSSNTLNSLRG